MLRTARVTLLSLALPIALVAQQELRDTVAYTTAAIRLRAQPARPVMSPKNSSPFNRRTPPPRPAAATSTLAASGSHRRFGPRTTVRRPAPPPAAATARTASANRAAGPAPTTAASLGG